MMHPQDKSRRSFQSSAAEETHDTMVVIIHILSIISSPINDGTNKCNIFDDLIRIFIIMPQPHRGISPEILNI